MSGQDEPLGAGASRRDKASPLLPRSPEPPPLSPAFSLTLFPFFLSLPPLRFSHLVIQKQLGQEAQVLAVVAVLAAVQLEKLNVVLAVDLIARGMPQLALGLEEERKRQGRL